MDLRCSPRQDATPFTLNEVALHLLLGQGLECIRQGNCEEGISFLERAREQLTSEQIHLAPFLEQVTKALAVYCQAREEFLRAKENFARAQREQKALLTTFKKLLSANDNGHYLQIQPEASSRYDQSLRESDSHQSPAPSRSHPHTNETLPDLYITCFGHFEVYREGQPVALCPNRNGQAILRYLVAQSDHYATADKLMGLLWPDDEQEVARHKVHVAVSTLRSSLNKGHDCDSGGGYILHKNRAYQINPAVSLKTDVDEFLSLYQAGRRTSGYERATLYEKACHLYVGPFLVEDTYADWSFIHREHLSQAHLSMCHTLSDYFLNVGRYEDTERWASRVLKENRCDEAAHKHLMLAYAAQGYRGEALRQYQRCERALRDELGVSPMPETVDIFQAILTHKQVFNDATEIERK